MRYENIKKGNKKTVKKMFNDLIDRILVVYGQKMEHGYKYFTPDEWFLHYEEMEKLKNIDINIFYKDGTHEKIETERFNYIFIQKVKNIVYSGWLFSDRFWYYLKLGWNNRKLVKILNAK